MSSDHFQGKSALEHLKEARSKGAYANAEVHGTEIPGHFSAAADSAKETTLVFLLLWIILMQFQIPHSQVILILSLFSGGFLIWKTGRSALLGWSRLERLNRVIEEERWEIEHHRYQEREELLELYRTKGFSGKLLDEVVDVLMADDNRLLRVMLEEEIGLKLESYEHPLKQSAGAAIGVIVAASLLLLGFIYLPLHGLPFVSILLFIGTSIMAARLENNRPLIAIVWNLAIALLASGVAYLLAQLIL